MTGPRNTPFRDFICEQCGKGFQAKRKARFCSKKCRERSRAKDPEYRGKQKQTDKRRKDKVTKWLRNYKLEHGCTDCGYALHPAALDFDHVKGEKWINVCQARSIEGAKREIKKCEVVCANCHRIRTFNRLRKTQYIVGEPL